MGGPRNAIAMLTDGFVIAHSDRASVRFGYGLSRRGLALLAARLREVLTSVRLVHTPLIRPPHIPRALLPACWPFVLVAGAAIAFLVKRGPAMAALTNDRLAVVAVASGLLLWFLLRFIPRGKKVPSG